MARALQDGLKKLDAGLPPSEPSSWLILVALGLMWLLVAGQRFAGPQFPLIASLVYAIYFVFPLVFDDKLKHDLLRGTLSEYIGKYSFGFLTTLAAYWIVFVYVIPTPPTYIAYSSVLPLAAFQVGVVTPVEELVFREWLPRRLERRGHGTARIYGAVSIGTLVNAAVFSTYHFGAFGTDSLVPYAIIFLLAMIWLWASRLKTALPFTSERRPMGIAITTGSHAAWNLCVLGILFGKVVTGA